MYNLREVSPTKEGMTTNTCLGNHYSCVNKHLHPQEFEKCLINLDIHDHDSCYAVVIYENGSNFIPLRKARKNYIVVDNGDTYEKLRHYDENSEKKNEQGQQDVFRSTIDHDISIICALDNMCTQSTPPEVGDLWQKVRSSLILNRQLPLTVSV